MGELAILLTLPVEEIVEPDPMISMSPAAKEVAKLALMDEEGCWYASRKEIDKEEEYVGE